MRLIDADALPKTNIVERKKIFVDRKPRTINLYEEVVKYANVERAPTIDPESLRLLAVWKYFHKQNIAVCTNCSFERDLNVNFGKAISCPNCGAKMKGVGENDTRKSY